MYIDTHAQRTHRHTHTHTHTYYTRVRGDISDIRVRGWDRVMNGVVDGWRKKHQYK